MLGLATDCLFSLNFSDILMHNLISSGSLDIKFLCSYRLGDIITVAIARNDNHNSCLLTFQTDLPIDSKSSQCLMLCICTSHFRTF